MTPQQLRDERIKAAMLALQDCIGILERAPGLSLVRSARSDMWEYIDELESMLTPEQEGTCYDPQDYADHGRFGDAK
jgi:hypothetical protein